FATPVHTLAWRITARREVADEAMPETFVEMIRSIADYRGGGSTGPGMRRSAVSKCLMHFRWAWNRLRHDCEPCQLDRSGAAPAACGGLAARRRGLHPSRDRAVDEPDHQFFQIPACAGACRIAGSLRAGA